MRETKSQSFEQAPRELLSRRCELPRIFGRLITAALLGLLVLTAPRAFASYVMELGIDDLTGRSDRVVRARVADRESRLDKERQRIYTFTTLEVISSLKGSGESRIVVRQLGGESGGMGSFVGGDAFFEVGEEVVVFIRRNPDGEPVYHLVGLALGKFRVERADGQARVSRDLSGLSLVRRGPDGAGFVEGFARDSMELRELETTVAEAIERR